MSELEIKCFTAVAEQPTTQPTYLEIACSTLVDDGGLNNFNGFKIPCETEVNRDIVDACINTSQGIRVTITVNDEDVSDSLVGSIRINHDLNVISTFSFQLGDPKYSPLVDANIAINAVVIITVYINGQEIKMFTGLLDSYPATFKGGYRLTITGRDYGKKLKVTKTLISIQESAQKKYRGSMVKYLAGQANQANVNIPQGDAVTIDHSFQDQEVWDMVQKECAIEGWYVRHDENGVMQVKTRTIKTNVASYPNADWEYGEGEFIQLGFSGSGEDVINKVIILGAIFEEETITQDGITDEDGEGWSAHIDWEDEEYEYTDYSFSPSFEAGEVVTGWTDGDAVIRVTASYIGFTKPSGAVMPTSQNYKFTISGSDSGKIQGLSFSVTGGATKIGQSSNSVSIARAITDYIEVAFSVTITFKIKNQTGGGIEEIESENPEDTFTSTITYTQVKATVTDATSIGVYGERKPLSAGTLDFPLAETPEQCKRVGENVILGSHEGTKQPDFKVPFNPLLIVGHTTELTDKKLGYNESRYLVKQAHHEIDINDDGSMKARTKVAGVFYA